MFPTAYISVISILENTCLIIETTQIQGERNVWHKNMKTIFKRLRLYNVSAQQNHLGPMHHV